MVSDKELTNKKDIANSLKEYFTTVASTLLANRPSLSVEPDLTDPTSNCTSAFQFQRLCEADVPYALQTIDSFKATSADNIPAKPLKIAALDICKVNSSKGNSNI